MDQADAYAAGSKLKPAGYKGGDVSASSEHGDDEGPYRVVVNDEEQYSIWPAYRDLPRGWTDAAKTGTKAECLHFIAETWTDMRPRSVRNA